MKKRRQHRHLQRLGGKFQVICITHLPQIAAYGSTHFRIVKNIRSGRTVTDVARVEGTEREEEVARMIGGNDLSVAVRASAREMIASRAKAKGEHITKGESERPRRKA